MNQKRSTEIRGERPVVSEDAGRSGAISPLFGVLVCQWQSDQSIAEEHTACECRHINHGRSSLGTVCRS